ncbi:MAG: hypothetical protein B7Y78_11040, partial [Caulobacter sp. 35-67-4]
MIEDQEKTRRVDDEAAGWFVRMNQLPVETSDLEAFFAWRQQPENLQAYNRIEDISRSVRDLAHDADLQAVARQAAVGPTWRQRWAGLLAPRSRAWGGALAMAGVLAAAAMAWLTLSPPTYSTAVGEQFATQLTDGSRVRLNTETLVRVHFKDGERNVELVRGQAFFEVAHDAARPFVVTADTTRVRAIGTRFDVRRTDADVRVTLTEGRVEVRDKARPGSDWRLDPGQTLAVGGTLAPTPVQADVATVTGWTTGRLTFRDMTLADAVAEMNRYSRDKIVLGAGAPSGL